MKPKNGVILLPVMAKLVPPTTPEDVEESLEVATAIREMTGIAEAELVLHGYDRPPWVRLRYAGADRPKAFWNRWLWMRLNVAHRLGIGWICRLAEIVPRRRELVFIPRPDAIDVSLALQSVESGSIPSVTSVKLGVIYPPHQTFRTFALLH